MTTWLWIMGGGAVGTGLRYGVGLMSHRLWGSDFPYGTLLVNLVGCFLIGLVATAFASGESAFREHIRLAVVVGLFGGFTTFSSFGFETWTLFEQGHFSRAALYVSVSNIVGFLAVWGGWRLSQTL
jgi:CrcB protein